jgi:hypothetical protein
MGGKRTFADTLAEYLHRVREREAVNDATILIVHVDAIAKVNITLANVAGDTVAGRYQRLLCNGIVRYLYTVRIEKDVDAID